MISTHVREKLVHHGLRRQAPGSPLANTVRASREDWRFNKGPNRTANGRNTRIHARAPGKQRHVIKMENFTIDGKHERAHERARKRSIVTGNTMQIIAGKTCILGLLGLRRCRTANQRHVFQAKRHQIILCLTVHPCATARPGRDSAGMMKSHRWHKSKCCKTLHPITSCTCYNRGGEAGAATTKNSQV